jgi:hypothetical protein
MIPFSTLQRRSAVWTSRMAFFRILPLPQRWPNWRRPLFLLSFLRVLAFWREGRNDLR